MTTSLRTFALGLITATALVGCNSNNDARTEELVQAKLNVEHMKELQTQNQELKTANEALKKENDSLHVELAKLQAKSTVAVGPRPKTPRPAASSGSNDKPSPAEQATLKDEVTGGSSFK